MALHKPNFFILGAAKCGTTSLNAYLRQHPEIFMSRKKETNFFSDGFQGFGSVVNPNRYFELFSSVKDEKIIGEASHSYMTSPSTAATLRLLFPEAKFVVILRNPADRAYSLYNHLRRYGHEPLASFEKALELEVSRSSSQRFIKSCKENIYNFKYFSSGLYAEQINRYLQLFDKEQFLFLKLDDLNNNPENTLKSIFRFLDVDDSFEVSAKIKNKGGVTARFPRFNHFCTIHLDKIISPKPPKKGASKWLHKLLFKHEQKMSDDTRKKLMDRYESDQVELEKLIGFRFGL